MRGLLCHNTRVYVNKHGSAIGDCRSDASAQLASSHDQPGTGGVQEREDAATTTLHVTATPNQIIDRHAKLGTKHLDPREWGQTHNE